MDQNPHWEQVIETQVRILALALDTVMAGTIDGVSPVEITEEQYLTALVEAGKAATGHSYVRSRYPDAVEAAVQEVLEVNC